MTAVDRHDPNVSHIEERYAPTLVASDFPDEIIIHGTPRAIDMLVSLADSLDLAPRAAWRWLRLDLSEAEAFAWLGMTSTHEEEE